MEEKIVKLPLRAMLTRLEDYTGFATSPVVPESRKQFYKGAASAIHDLLCISGYGGFSDHFIDILNGEEDPAPFHPEFARVIAGIDAPKEYDFPDWDHASDKLHENFQRDAEGLAMGDDIGTWDEVVTNLNDTIADWNGDSFPYTDPDDMEEIYAELLDEIKFMYLDAFDRLTESSFDQPTESAEEIPDAFDRALRNFWGNDPPNKRECYSTIDLIQSRDPDNPWCEYMLDVYKDWFKE